MVKLYDSNITDILPEVFANNPKVKALGYAINKAMQRLINYCQNISIYASLDTVPEKVLDLLAIELHTQYYDDTMDIEIKRTLIKNTLNWYMYAGTAASVTELVASVFGSGEIEEWFQYGGEPYHFKIHTSNIASTDEMIQLAETLVKSVQNVRSYLEEIIVQVIESMTLYIGCSVLDVTTDDTLYCDALLFGTCLVDETGQQLVTENEAELYYL